MARQYNVEESELTWLNIDLMPGIAEGTFIQEAQSNAEWTRKKRGRGGIVRIRNPGNDGTVSITMDRESSEHLMLKGIAADDAESGNKVGMMVYRNTRSGEVIRWVNAYIEDSPDEVGITNAGQTVVWVFGFEARKDTPMASLSGNKVGD